MGSIQSRLAHSEQELPLDRRHLVLGRELGSGNIATVYEGHIALPWNITTPVAIKVFSPVASDERESVVEVISKAAAVMARCRHPNVVQIMEFGLTASGRPFLVEEMVEGCSLADLLALYEADGQRVPLDLALFIGLEVADALAGALASSPPGARLVHGDLSAREVLVSRHGMVKVSDFGIGAATRASSGLHSMSALARRTTSLAPEVLDGNEGDPRSDVFSLGVILWQMLVGPRFPSSMSDSQALALARQGFVHSTIFDPNLPDDLRALLVRALAAAPGKRFPDAGALAYELRRIAFVLGVGDGRPFLRAAIESALGLETAPSLDASTPANDAWGEGEGQEEEIVLFTSDDRLTPEPRSITVGEGDEEDA